jgi:hypothetical protein
MNILTVFLDSNVYQHAKIMPTNEDGREVMFPGLSLYIGVLISCWHNRSGCPPLPT